MSKRIVFAFLLGISVLALYGDDSAVVRLTAKNFKDLVINSDEFWLVEFYGKNVNRQRLGVVTANTSNLTTKKQQRYSTEL